MESSQNRHSHYQYPQHTISTLNSRDTVMSINTVPVYRHGRKFYVSIEEFERMRAEERRNRRALMQKSQNLPIPRSYQTNLRSPLTSSHNSINRNTSYSHEHRYGILRTPHLPANSTIINNHNISHVSTRQSRSAYKYYDDHDNALSITPASPVNLTKSTTRSNSSDKLIDFRRTPQSSMSSYNSHIPHDYDLKRSFSAELVQPSQIHVQQPQVLLRRIDPPTSSNYGMSNLSSVRMSPSDQMYKQSNVSKTTSYFNRMQPSPLNSQTKSSASEFSERVLTYENNVQDSDPSYFVLPSSNRHNNGGLPLVLTRSSSNNSNNEYYLRDVASGSLSDDDSLSQSLLAQRKNLDTNRYRRTELVVETDDDCGQQSETWIRPTARSQSSDGITEKKRVRFADMEGYTLETVSDVEQKKLPMNDLLLKKRPYAPLSSNTRKSEQSFHDSFYPMTGRVGISGSKLATDV